MEFDEHEEQEEEIGMHQMQGGNYQTLAASGREGEGVSTAAATGGRKTVGGGAGGGNGDAGGSTATTYTSYRYRECLKNHAVGIGGQAVDGCGEFMPAGEEGTLESLKCAACNCHRNFHRKETEGEGFHHPHPAPHHHHHSHPHHHQQFSAAYSFRSPHPSGYLHVTPPPTTRPLALPSSSREEEGVSNPSSSGGGGGGGGEGTGGSKKRFRTKFTPDQKEKMLAYAERLGWRIQKQDEALVQQFCAETNVKRHVLKVWMHNNKHTLGKKP